MVVGLFALVGGAELLVRGASRIAALAGIPPLIVGLTVVALGTSAPELAITLKSSFTGNSDLAVGNIVGSNILNILFILGIASLAAPLVITKQLLRIDVPVLIAASVSVWVVSLDGSVSKIEGAILFFSLIIYTLILIVEARKKPQQALVKCEVSRDSQHAESSLRITIISIVLVIAGLILLTIGARWLVSGAVSLAQTIGISELIIGLTIVAIGTSLPEAATTIMASIRGERDIAVGNAIGSSILNILLVLGFSSMIAPQNLTVAPNALSLDIPFMIATAVACLPLFFTGGKLSRWEGALFLLFYAGYVVFLVLNALGHWAIKPYSTIVLTFIIPLTAIGIIISVIDGFRQHKAESCD